MVLGSCFDTVYYVLCSGGGRTTVKLKIKKIRTKNNQTKRNTNKYNRAKIQIK